MSERPDACLLVIFGASGDLTKRKLIPALYELYRQGHLPETFAMLGISRSDIGDEGFRERMKATCSGVSGHTEEQWAAFEQMLFYEAADATDPAAMVPIGERIHALQASQDLGANLLFYLSLAPQIFEQVVEGLGTSGLLTEGKRWCSLARDRAPWQRIIVEKPFGHDLASAAHLNRVLGRIFEDEDIYRIDHYLGKETVQNLNVFRFANSIFEPLWNRQYVSHVQITAAETVGVEGRGGYYESSGAMRDMIQSHLLQLMAAVAMDVPISIEAQYLRSEQRKVLEAVRDVDPARIDEVAVRGQYVTGQMDGEMVLGYTEEPGVSETSNTETYAAMKVYIDNWRWKGVPFYLRTGKRMHRKLTQIVMYFKPTPHDVFDTKQIHLSSRPSNRLVINVQPDEGISLRFEGKVPGQGTVIQSAVMDFDYQKQFGGHIPEAYSHLLLEAMLGDQSLFKDRHEIESAWRIVMPVLDHWASHPNEKMHRYTAGSWGPDAAEGLFAAESQAADAEGHWHDPDQGSSTR